MLSLNIENIRKVSFIIFFTFLLVLGLSACNINIGGGRVLPKPTEIDNGQAADDQDRPRPTDSDKDSPKPTDSDKDKDDQANNAKRAEQILQDYARSYGRVNQQIFDFELEDLEGKTYKLSDLEGKVVFLNFWGTWCPPCRAEMPHMQAFYDKYKDDGAIVLAVSPEVVENQRPGSSSVAEGRVRDFIGEHGYSFPVLLDSENEVWGIYQQRSIPTTYIIDGSSIIRYLKFGAFQSLEEMEAFLEAARINISMD